MKSTDHKSEFKQYVVWIKDENTEFDAGIVSKLYKFLFNDQDARSLHQSRYLEKYLWPHYSTSANKDHTVSIAILSSKETDTDHLWSTLLDSDEKFDHLWSQVVSLSVNKKVDLYTRGFLLEFITRASLALHHRGLRSRIGPLVSIGRWECLSETTRSRIFEQHPRLRKSYNAASKKTPTPKLNLWLYNVISQWIDVVLNHSLQRPTATNAIQYLDKALRLFIAFIGQLPLRRFTRTIFQEFQVTTMAKIARKNHPLELHALCDCFVSYIHFPIDDFTGEALGEKQMYEAQQILVKKLQQCVFEAYNDEDKMLSLVVANIGKICHGDFLKGQLDLLDDKSLLQLAGDMGVTQFRDDRAFAQLCLIDKYCSSSTFTGLCYKLATMPNETELIETFNNPLLTGSQFQYLSGTDFLYRTFITERSRDWAPLRKVLENLTLSDPSSPIASQKMKAKAATTTVTGVGQVQVGQPRTGEHVPAHVRVDIEVSAKETDAGWKRLSAGENLYLIKKGTSKAGNPHTLRTAVFVKAESKRNGQTVTVDLDPEAYLHDKQVPSFDLLLRLAPYDNHSSQRLSIIKAVLVHGLETGEPLAIDWLSDKFLGFGDPQELTQLPSSDGSVGQETLASRAPTQSIGRYLRSRVSLIRGAHQNSLHQIAYEITNRLCCTSSKERILVVCATEKDSDKFTALLGAHGLSAHQVCQVSTNDTARFGNVDYFIEQRREILKRVRLLVDYMGVTGDYDEDCSSACKFFLQYIAPAWDSTAEDSVKTTVASTWLKLDDRATPLDDSNVIESCIEQARDFFDKIEILRKFELVKDHAERQRIFIGSTVQILVISSHDITYKLPQLIDYGFHYTTVLMTETNQIPETVGALPLFQLGNWAPNIERLVLLAGDQEKGPQPEQPQQQTSRSLFTRMVDLGFPLSQISRQITARPEIAEIWADYLTEDITWESTDTNTTLDYNPGILKTIKFINVGEYQGKGETGGDAGRPSQIENLGEAEYAIALYQYMRLLGYPASKISILTHTIGQKALILKILNKRCNSSKADRNVFGLPSSVATLEEYQGSSNDYTIVSLVRTKELGDLQNVKKLAMAFSYGRLGLYVVGREDLFRGCKQLSPVMARLDSNSLLELVTGELFDPEPAKTSKDQGRNRVWVTMQDVVHLGQYVHEMTARRYAYDAENAQRNGKEH